MLAAYLTAPVRARHDDSVDRREHQKLSGTRLVASITSLMSSLARPRDEVVHVRRLAGTAREAHEGSVPSGGGIRGTARGIAGAFEAHEGRAHGVADVEAPSGRAQVAVAPPADVAHELVDRVEAAPLDQALGEAERHGRVVGPGPGGEVERTAADELGDGAEGAGRAEFKGGTEGVAEGETQEGAAG